MPITSPSVDAPAYRTRELDPQAMRAAWEGVHVAFAAIGRQVLCLDRDFVVLHASPDLDAMLGPHAAGSIVGRRADAILGEGLFGPDAPLGRALVAGERCEDVAAVLAVGDRRSRVAISAAPLASHGHATCDPRAAYLIVLRGGQSSEPTGPWFDGDAARLVAALHAHRWRREPAARALGVSRATLWRRMRALGLTER